MLKGNKQKLMKLIPSFLKILVIAILSIFQTQIIEINAQQNSDSNYVQTTIYANDSNGNRIGSMTGEFTEGTTLIMENDPSKLGYADIMKTYLSDADYSEKFSYGINVSNGSYKGKVQIAFNVGEKYNGMQAVVVALANDPTKEPAKYDTMHTEVKDGNITITIAYPPLLQRTPFVIGLLQSDNAGKQPQNQTPAIQNQQKKENLYQDKMLSDKTDSYNICVKGSFIHDAKLKVNELSNKNDNYKKLSDAEKGKKIIGAYDVMIPMTNIMAI